MEVSSSTGLLIFQGVPTKQFSTSWKNIPSGYTRGCLLCHLHWDDTNPQQCLSGSVSRADREGTGPAGLVQATQLVSSTTAPADQTSRHQFLPATTSPGWTSFGANCPVKTSDSQVRGGRSCSEAGLANSRIPGSPSQRVPGILCAKYFLLKGVCFPWRL